MSNSYILKEMKNELVEYYIPYILFINKEIISVEKIIQFIIVKQIIILIITNLKVIIRYYIILNQIKFIMFMMDLLSAVEQEIRKKELMATETQKINIKIMEQEIVNQKTKEI